MKRANNHLILVYQRGEQLFVETSLKTSAGYSALDEVRVVENGFAGLPQALGEAEKYALEELGLPEEERHYAKGTAVVKAAGCKSYREFVKGTLCCHVYRMKKECSVLLMVPTARNDGFSATDTERECDPKAAIETLAPLVRKTFESV